MILWTVVPEEIIFAGQNQPVISCEEIEYLGQKVMAEKISQNEFRIVRLLTTDPADYLRNELQPGRIITCKPVFEGFS